MIAMLGWFRTRKQEEQEWRARNLRDRIANISDKWWLNITASKIDVSAITTDNGKFKKKKGKGA